MGNYCFACMMEVAEGIQVCPNCNQAIPYVSTNSRDCPPGTVLNNKYLIGKAIGRGGFGVTYVAVNLHTGEKVCIKECNLKGKCYRDPENPAVLLPLDDEESREEFKKYKEDFLNEKKRLIQLRDIPQVVHCYEGIECNNTAYIIQEYLEGRDLKNYVKRERGAKNPLSVTESIRFTIDILDVLERVHKRRILHRDISPDNIFLLKDGTIKLIDFGSSRRLNGGEMTGFNKPGYAPPEMLLGDAEGYYSDIYSVGAVLYFLLVGEKPEQMEGVGILQPPPKGKSFPELTEIFFKATHRNVEWRYQSAGEMAEDLRHLIGEQREASTTHTKQHKKKKRKKAKKGLYLVVGVLATIIVVLVFVIIKAGTTGNDVKPNGNNEWIFVTEPVRTQTIFASTPVVSTATPTPAVTAPVITAPADTSVPTPSITTPVVTTSAPTATATPTAAVTTPVVTTSAPTATATPTAAVTTPAVTTSAPTSTPPPTPTP
ncbi:MAG: hypothetical protein E7322_06565, partial [Clostridiales bacterium]|nr:hypothetical protein [Clostridiales bacterium]